MGQPHTMSNASLPQTNNGRKMHYALALEEIKNSLTPFARPEQPVTSSNNFECMNALIALGYDEETSSRATIQGGGRLDVAIEVLKQQNLHHSQQRIQADANELSSGAPPALPPRTRHTLEPPPRVPAYSSQAVNNGASTTTIQESQPAANCKLSSSNMADDSNAPPPVPPPRGTPLPPPTPPRGKTPPPSSSQQFAGLNSTNIPPRLRRMSPVPVVHSSRSGQNGASSNQPSNTVGLSSQRGTSPVATQPLRVANSYEIKQQFQQHFQQQLTTLTSVFPVDGASEPPPPYPMGSAANPPPPYSQSVAMRQSPTLSCTSSDYRAMDFRRSPAPLPHSYPYHQVITNGLSSAASPIPASPSPASSMMSTSSRSSIQAWSARQAKTHSPVIMQSVKSTQVQKPILQTATGVAVSTPIETASSPSPYPTAPQPQVAVLTAKSSVLHGVAMSVITAQPSIETCTIPPPAPPPSYEFSIQQKQQQQQRPLPMTPSPSPVVLPNNSPLPLQRNMSPALQESNGKVLPPPPPYPSSAVSGLAAEASQQQMVCGTPLSAKSAPVIHTAKVVANTNTLVRTIESKPPLVRKYSPLTSETGSSASRSESPTSDSQTVSAPSPLSFSSNATAVLSNTPTLTTDSGIGYESSALGKEHHTSPKPERKQMSQAKEEARRESLIKNCPPEAFKFFMEQHVENIIKEYEQRRRRKMTLERELVQFGIKDPHSKEQMRMVLRRKETNYLRMRRAKLNRKDFKKIKTIGVGAFGEVSLVRSLINGSKPGGLFAMKTLKKSVVVERKQVAHVIAEKDILAESENEWIVKLFYSFQDKDYLYFVMEYIPGGDLMSMLIKEGRFTEDLARFYIAELTCAVESVHSMGFIHRDIKPDNILIDAAGHIKLTDFGLCTGFRWTHNSEYYHNKNGNHYRQDSMDPINMKDLESGSCSCPHVANGMKPLERRRKKQNQRCMAHSLVGTPNYIAPEVLLKQGYTQSCDWWSVGVILYEMIIGQPPFLAENTINTQAKVVRWRETLNIPRGVITREAEEMIRGLCTDAENRLGSHGGAEEVKRQSFLNGIDFSKSIRSQHAPWRPEIKYETDTSNFDPVDPERLFHDHSDSDEDSSGRRTKDSHGFYEFTFRRFFDDGGHPLRLVNDDRAPSASTNCQTTSIAPGPVYV